MVDATEMQSRVDSLVWYHSLDLGNGVVTNGYCTSYLGEDQLPDFEGKTVLDIGAWDGYYSFLAERCGAARVVALDHYAWGVDFSTRNPYWDECAAKGKRGFDIAHEVYGSRVEAVVGNFATIDPGAIGMFDIVLFLGVLYHLKEPLTALEAVKRLTRSVAVIETEALLVPGHERWSGLEFTAGYYRGYDYSNWFTPTIEAVHELCRAAGFSRTATISGPPALPGGQQPAQPRATPSDWRQEITRIQRGVRRRLSYLVNPPVPVVQVIGEPTHYRCLVHAAV
jgi:tRNA (mo5U34)-methyltransferase